MSTKSAVLIITLLFTGTLTLAFNIRPVRANGIIYIRADGSIDPPTTPITTTDNITYTLTGNIIQDDGEIVIERDNIVVDGAGYRIQGGVSGFGIAGRIFVMIANVTFEGCQTGIWLDSSSGVSLVGNTITCIYMGISMETSSNNSIVRNTITRHSWAGILIGGDSSDNRIVGNTIGGNNEGIYFSSSSNNSVYHNNFVNNTVQVNSAWKPVNIWDDGYPSGGNYWSDYIGADMLSGPFQNETGSDGIGDISYNIVENNTDRYPLINPWGKILLGDLNDDLIVDIFDAVILASAFNSKPGDSNWKSNADINGDNIVDIYDAIILANHFNQHIL